VVHVLASVLLVAQLCPVPETLRFAQQGGTCAFGACPSFELTVHGNKASLRCQRWILPDGAYSASISAGDAALLHCLANDLAEVHGAEVFQILLCRHGIEFRVTVGTSHRVSHIGACVGEVPLARAQLTATYELIQRLAVSYCWSPIAPATPSGT